MSHVCVEPVLSKHRTPVHRYFSVGEFAKCVQLLDAPRQARQSRGRLKKLEGLKKSGQGNVKEHKLSSLRTHIHNLETEPHKGSLSGAKQRFFRQWVRGIPKETLEFFLLNFPVKNWRAICDLACGATRSLHQLQGCAMHKPQIICPE